MSDKKPPLILPDPETMSFSGPWGEHFTVKRCEKCGQLVKSTKREQHAKSGCKKGVFVWELLP